MSHIDFYIENITFSLEKEEAIKQWITLVITQENKAWEKLTYILCSDEYLYDINIKYLQHDTYTDIITFPTSKDPIESDIFVSIDRIRENAKAYNVSFEDELRRVLIHGVLHLCGYRDKTAAEQQQMTQKEDEALDLWKKM